MSPSAANPSIRLGLALGAELGKGESNTLNDVPANPSIPIVPPLKIPRIPLPSPQDRRERVTDEASEEEGGRYSRRSAVQQSALLEAIGEDHCAMMEGGAKEPHLSKIIMQACMLCNLRSSSSV